MDSSQPLSPDPPKPAVNQTPPEKPISILPVVLIFFGISLSLIVIIISVYFFIILPKIKNEEQITSTNNNKTQSGDYRIKTSNCQDAAFEPITPNPYHKFMATLGSCDSSYQKFLADSNYYERDKHMHEIKNTATSAIDAAQKNFQKGIAMWLLGLYYYNAKDFASTETILTKSIEFAPEFSNSYSLLSSTYFAKGDFNNAETYGKKCVDLNPTFNRCHSGYGVALLANGKNEQGFKELEQAISLLPNDQYVRDLYKSSKDYYK